MFPSFLSIGLAAAILAAFLPPPAAQAQAGVPFSPEAEPGQRLTLANALALALQRNPRLASFSAEVRARDARALQAGLLPNPELEGSLEDFGGSGDRRGFTSAESTLRLSQLIELGGKRGLRVAVASLDRSLGEWDYAAKSLDVFADTTKAFTDVLISQRRVVLAQGVTDLATTTVNAVSERVRAGRVPPLDESRARVGLSVAQIELRRAQRELETARKRLSAQWAGNPPVNTIAGDLDRIEQPLPLEEVLAHANRNPDIKRWQTEIEQRQAVLDLERSKWVPDVRASAGIRRYEDTRDNAFVVGVAIPLPLFDRNQGGIAEAGHKYTKALEERRAEEVRARTELTNVHQTLSVAFAEAISFRADVLPAAQRTLDAARASYREGRVGLLEVLEAQRLVVDAQARQLDALAEYHKSAADLDRLTGGTFANATASAR